MAYNEDNDSRLGAWPGFIAAAAQASDTWTALHSGSPSAPGHDDMVDAMDRMEDALKLARETDNPAARVVNEVMRAYMEEGE